MSGDLGFSTPKCDKPGCPREGEELRWNVNRRLLVKGSPTREVVMLNVFLCEQYGPQKTLHNHYTGPNGEKVERINNHGGFRYVDAITGAVIATTCGTGKHNFSAESRQKLSEAIKGRFWFNPKEKARRVKLLQSNEWNFQKAWSDPAKREFLEEANRTKSADPEYRQRMSQAHLNLSPEKKRNKSEGVRAARLRERKRLDAIMVGRAAKDVYAKGHELNQRGLSWAQVTIKLDPEYKVNPDFAVARMKQGVRRYRKTHKLK